MALLMTDHLRGAHSQRRNVEPTEESKAAASLLSSSSFPKEQLLIKLENDRPFYTNLDVIAGSIEYSESLNFQAKALIVELLGVTRLTKSVWQGNQYKNVIVEWPFLRRTSQIDIDRELGKSPFSIQIPSLMQPRQCPVGNHMHLALPPTTGDCNQCDGLDDMTDVHTAAQVTYLIRAELRCLDEDRALGHVSQRFRFIPQTSLFKTVMEEEDEDSSTMTFTEPVQDIFKMSHGSLTLALTKNATIYTTGMAKPLTSPLQLSLRYKGNSPPDISKASLRLLSTTIRRTKHQHEERTQFPEPAPFVARDLLGTELSSKSRQWDASRTELHVWTMGITLPVTLIHDDKTVCLPSFESCLLSRRYKLQLTLGLSSTSSFRSLRSVQYIFPIDVEADIRKARTKNQSGVQYDTRGLEVVPTYDETEAASLCTAPIMRVPQYVDTVPDLERLRRPSWHCKAETAPNSVRGSSSSSSTVTPSTTRSPPFEETLESALDYR